MSRRWRMARSLDQLLEQINTAYPTRSKVSDGGIGDAAHASSKSEHNPDRDGVVRARDFTHDPAHGLDADQLARSLVASRDPRILYVISRGRIASSVVEPWVWRKYVGVDPHTNHVHVSVVPNRTLYDNARPWAIAAPKKVSETMDSKDANVLWTTPQTRKGTVPTATSNESPLDILTRLARNVETIGALVKLLLAEGRQHAGSGEDE